MERVLALAAAIVAGGLFAAQPPINSALGRYTGVLAAAFISLVVSALLVGVVLVAAGEAPALSRAFDAPTIYLLGGIVGAVNVAVMLVTVRVLGAAGVIAAMICGQLVVSALLDSYGAFGLDRIGVTPARLAGLALLFAGTLLVAWR
jgi:bacterial/archaeal transporter family-2 protein